MGVIINELANEPHHEGQIVLHCKRETFELKVLRSGSSYWVHGEPKRPGGASWTTLMAERKTMRAARELARRVWAEGENFNVRIGA